MYGVENILNNCVLTFMVTDGNSTDCGGYSTMYANVRYAVHLKLITMYVDNISSFFLKKKVYRGNGGSKYNFLSKTKCILENTHVRNYNIKYHSTGDGHLKNFAQNFFLE